jgi:hypothetical protein
VAETETRGEVDDRDRLAAHLREAEDVRGRPGRQRQGPRHKNFADIVDGKRLERAPNAKDDALDRRRRKSC